MAEQRFDTATNKYRTIQQWLVMSVDCVNKLLSQWDTGINILYVTTSKKQK